MPSRKPSSPIEEANASVTRETPNQPAQLIEQSEGEVFTALEKELAPHITLVERITNLAVRMIERLESEQGEPRAIHVGAIILSRLVTDLQACAILARRGYAAQAAALTAGMLELAHTCMFIGADDAKADQWLAHDDPRRASPWRLKDTIKAVARELRVDEAAAVREYDGFYRQMNMAKHGNPIAMSQVGVITTDDATHVVVGPYLSDPVRQLCRAALWYAMRYVKLLLIKFVRDHLPQTVERDEIFHELVAIDEESDRVRALDFSEFEAISIASFSE
jgi:hypothetical protein